MTEPAAMKDPRWGAECRDAKALAILETLRSEVGAAVVSGTWLDVGCGSGLIASELAQHVHEIHGLDPEPWARWPVLSAEHPNLHFHAGAFRDVPDELPPESVDVVICNQVYEHVDSPEDLLSQLHLVLKPHGVCYFAGPNLLWPIEPHVFWPFVHWLPRASAKRLMRLLGSQRADELDAWSLDAWRLQGLMKKAGFTIKCAFSSRARAGRDLGEGGAAIRLAAALPPFVTRIALPILPSFIFILRKAGRQ